MSTLIAITLFVALVSFNVTKTTLLRPMRVALARRTPRRLRDVWRCHYCLSHHVAWLTLLVANWHYPFGTRLDPLLTWAAVVVLAGPVMTAIDWAISAMDSFDRVFRIRRTPEPVALRAYLGDNDRSSRHGADRGRPDWPDWAERGEWGERGERLVPAEGLPPRN